MHDKKYVIKKLAENGISIDTDSSFDFDSKVKITCDKGHKDEVRGDSLNDRYLDVFSNKRFVICSECQEIAQKQYEYDKDKELVKEHGFDMINRTRIKRDNFKFDLLCHRGHTSLKVDKFHLDTFKCLECKIIDLVEATELPCLRCNLSLALALFSKDSSNKGRKGYDKYCKSCRKIEADARRDNKKQEKEKENTTQTS